MKAFLFNLLFTSMNNVVEPEKTMEIYGIDGWPYFFLINKAGVIVDKRFGARKRKLRRVVQKWVK